MRILRHTVPSRYDRAPYGTLCTVKGDDGREKLYVQLGVDEYADWVSMGDLLMEVFKERSNQKEFVDECIASYNAAKKK